jgi:hypothetical protein
VKLAFLTLVIGHDRDISEESRIRIFQGQRLDLVVTVRNLLHVIGFMIPPERVFCVLQTNSALARRGGEPARGDVVALCRRALRLLG